MRLFTALEFPQDVRDHLVAAIEAIRPAIGPAASFTRPENLHVTLKFFGEVADAQIPRLCTALRSLPVPRLRLFVERFICLPSRGPTRILAANLGGDVKPLGEFFERTESACAPMGIARERRAFKPHVTLARFKVPPSRHTPNSLVKLINPALLPSPVFVADQFVLMQSDLRPMGPVYTTTARFGGSTSIDG